MPVFLCCVIGPAARWIKFDIIVGAVLIFLYMVMCGFHRCVRALFEPCFEVMCACQQSILCTPSNFAFMPNIAAATCLLYTHTGS